MRVTVGSNDDVEPAWSPGHCQAGRDRLLEQLRGWHRRLRDPLDDAGGGLEQTRLTTIDGTDGQPVWIPRRQRGFDPAPVVSQPGGGQGPGLYTNERGRERDTKVAGTNAGDTEPRVDEAI